MQGTSGSPGWPRRLAAPLRAQGRPGRPAGDCRAPGERHSPRGSGRACRKQPPSGCRRRPLRRHRALSSRHRSASGPPGSPLPAAGPAAGHRGPSEASPELSPGGPGRPRPPRRANGEVLTYLSLLSTPSWIHLSTSPQSIVGKPSPASSRPGGSGGGAGALRTGRALGLGRAPRTGSGMEPAPRPELAATAGGSWRRAATGSSATALLRRLSWAPAASGGWLFSLLSLG